MRAIRRLRVDVAYRHLRPVRSAPMCVLQRGIMGRILVRLSYQLRQVGKMVAHLDLEYGIPAADEGRAQSLDLEGVIERPHCID